MIRIRLRWPILAFLIVQTVPATEPIHHIGLSFEDRFVDCATAAFGKRVLLSGWTAVPDKMVCPAPRDDLISALKDMGISIAESGLYIVLLPSRMMPGGDLYSALVSTNFDIQVKVIDGTKWIRGSLPLTPSEQEEISRTIEEAARWPPIFPIDWIEGGRKRVDPGGRVAVDINLQLDGSELKPGVKSVVAIFGEAAQTKRMVYGELRNGKYLMMWDSPLMGGGNLSLDYQDVDGDGKKEIIASWAELPNGSATAIFTTEGGEITRQVCREEEQSLLGRGIGFACPVHGEHVSLAELQEGKRDILVVPYNSQDLSHPDRYALVNGRYALPSSVLTSITPVKVTMGTKPPKLTILGRNFARGSIVKFCPVESNGYFKLTDYYTDFPEFITPSQIRIQLPGDVMTAV
ncbi:MAG: hypothetical protein ACRD4H_10705, partial [Candidatus Acidiferrales bacterium]